MSVTDPEKTEIFRRIEESEKRDYQAIYQQLKKTNGNGNKLTIGVIVGIVSAFAAVVGVAVVKPMQQQINFLSREIERHSILDGHATALERHATASERFKEVETQFDALREVFDKDTERANARFYKLEEWQKWWYRSIFKEVEE